MYGLTQRLVTRSVPYVVSRGAAATVLVLDRDPVTLDLLRRATADHYRIIIAANGDEALAMIAEERPDVVMLDSSLDSGEIALVTISVAACDELDAMPVVLIDPEQLTDVASLRRCIDEAIRVARRVYMGGGLLHRVAA
jgi:PleD family two-component response regulator